MDGPDYRLTNFLTFLPSPKRLLPITAAHRGLWGADAESCGCLTGRHSPCKMVGRHGLRRPLPWVRRRHHFLSAHRSEKVRSHMRIDCSPAPPPHPRYLGLHIFCSFGFGLLRLRSTVAAATRFLSLATAAKAAQTKALPKRHLLRPAH
jgi:hypothetical protein